MTFNDQIYRQNAAKVCILSLLKGNVATVTSIGRGIGGDTSDRHNIKRADRLLSNPHLLAELPHIYDLITPMVRSAGRMMGKYSSLQRVVFNCDTLSSI